MNLSELRHREAFDDVLAATLARHLTRLRHSAVEVAPSPRAPHGSTWREHRLFGAFIGPGDATRARRFLTDLYRFSPSPTRWLPQATAATIAGSVPGFRALSHPRLWISDAFEGRHAPLILPGNQRVRFIDFDTETVHVFQKDGFDLRTMRSEVETRLRFAPRFLEVLNHDVAGGWFTEPFVEAWALARVPPWVNRQRARRSAEAQLESWRNATRRRLPREEYAGRLGAEIDEASKQLETRFQSALGAQVRTLARRLLGLVRADTVEVAQSHGDFQPGNVLVRKRDLSTILIDLEHAGERSSAYDELTYSLSSRSAAGLADRAAAFLAADRIGPTRADAVAWFLAEDLLFFVRESLTGPFRRPSMGLGSLLGEVHRLLTMWTWPG